MIFYRHPTPQAAPGLCYGRFDLDIAPEGRAEIAAACAAAPACSTIISSPAKRAMALARPLAETAGASLTMDDRWWEMNFGAWEGQLWSEIDRRESDPWVEDLWNRAPPDGETFGEVYERVKAALADAPASAVIVAHAGTIRAAKMILIGESIEEAFAWRPPFAQAISFRRSPA